MVVMEFLSHRHLPAIFQNIFCNTPPIYRTFVPSTRCSTRLEQLLQGGPGHQRRGARPAQQAMGAKQTFGGFRLHVFAGSITWALRSWLTRDAGTVPKHQGETRH